jgi:hypothetical protein
VARPLAGSRGEVRLRLEKSVRDARDYRPERAGMLTAPRCKIRPAQTVAAIRLGEHAVGVHSRRAEGDAELVRDCAPRLTFGNAQGHIRLGSRQREELAQERLRGTPASGELVPSPSADACGSAFFARRWSGVHMPLDAKVRVVTLSATPETQAQSDT